MFAATAFLAMAPTLTSSMTPDDRDIATRNGPAIVQIAAAPVTREEPTTHQRATASDISPDDPYYRFYRYLPIRHARIVASSVGSGFIVSPDGVILTNAHWVRDASTVSVRLADQRTFKGEVLGVDLLTDVAVIKIDAHALATVTLGDSAGLAVGQPVLAIGAPDGPRVNATAGTVSALSRSKSLVPFVRTNIAARPSGSGGPLVNDCGRVVGINARISTGPKGHYQVSFAIPIDVALSLASMVVPPVEIPRAAAEDCKRSGVP